MDSHDFFIEPGAPLIVEASHYREGLPGVCLILTCKGYHIKFHLSNTREGTDFGLDIVHAVDKLLQQAKRKPAESDAAFVAKQPF